MISWIKEMNVWMFVRRDLLDWSSQGCRTIIQHYLKQRNFIRFANIRKQYVYHMGISGQLDLNHPKSWKEKRGQKESGVICIKFMIRKQVRYVVQTIYSKCVRGQFVRVLSTTQESTLDDVQHGRVRKIQTTFCQLIFVNVPNPHSPRQINQKCKKKTASTI